MTDSDATEQATSRPTGPIGYLLALSVAVLLLYVLATAFQGAACAWILPLVVVVALPLWRYQTDRLLFERRAFLASVATPTGRLWQWFWRGRFVSVVQVFVALVFAAVMLLMLSPLRPLHWAVLGVDAILMALLIHPVRRMLSGQIRTGYIGLVARRWPLTAINVLLLSIGFVYVDYAVLGWPDTRTMPWIQVVEHAFESSQDGVTCPTVAVLLGVAGAVGAVTRHAASLVIPSLSAGPINAIAWFLFLAWTGIGAFLITRFLLGVVALIDRLGTTEAGTDDRTTRAFVYTILALAIAYLYASIKLAGWDPAQIRIPIPSPVVVEDPCRSFRFDSDSLKVVLRRDVDLARSEAHAEAERRIDAALDRAFGAAEQGVDRYLDWYYSMLGDYSRLAAVVTGDIGQLMGQQLAKHVFVDSNVSGLLETASLEIERESMDRMETAATAAGTRIGRAVQESPCAVPQFDPSRLLNLQRDTLRGAVATSAGTAVTAKFLLKKPVAAAAGKLAAKGTVTAAGKVAAKAAAKTAAKKGASALASGGVATVACSGLGPVAIACGIGAGIVTWLTVDKVVLEVDEFVNREDMRAELLVGLAQQRDSMRQELVNLHRGLVDLYAAEINERAGSVFIPARDGT